MSIFVGEVSPNNTIVKFTVNNLGSLNDRINVVKLYFNMSYYIEFRLLLEPVQNLESTEIYLFDAPTGFSSDFTEQVPGNVVFPVGDTHVRMELRDDNVYFYNDDDDTLIFDFEFLRQNFEESSYIRTAFENVLPVAIRYELYGLVENVSKTKIDEFLPDLNIREHNGHYVGDIVPNNTNLNFIVDNADDSTSQKFGVFRIYYNIANYIDFFILLNPGWASNTAHFIEVSTPNGSFSMDLSSTSPLYAGIHPILVEFRNNNIYFYNNETLMFDTEFLYELEENGVDEFLLNMNRYEINNFPLLSAPIDNNIEQETQSSEIFSEQEESFDQNLTDQESLISDDNDKVEQSIRGSGRLSSGAITGIVICSILGVIIIATIVAILLDRYIKSKKENTATLSS